MMRITQPEASETETETERESGEIILYLVSQGVEEKLWKIVHNFMCVPSDL